MKARKIVVIVAALLAVAIGTLAVNTNAGNSPAVGAKAPAFNLQDQNGDWHSLDDYKGKWLTVYFYPKDDTPGCTTEACNFRDSIFAFKSMGAEVIGISVDDVESHKEFESKYDLPFTLLADPGGKTCDEYGVLRDFKLMKLANRETFIIDPEGQIAKHYEEVNPDVHTREVLEDLERFMKAR